MATETCHNRHPLQARKITRGQPLCAVLQRFRSRNLRFRGVRFQGLRFQDLRFQGFRFLGSLSQSGMGFANRLIRGACQRLSTTAIPCSRDTTIIL